MHFAALQLYGEYKNRMRANYGQIDVVLACKHNSTKSPQSVSLESDPAPATYRARIATELRDNHMSADSYNRLRTMLRVTCLKLRVSAASRHGHWINLISSLDLKYSGNSLGRT